MQILRAFLIAAAVAGSLFSSYGAAIARPNFLLIYTDDQRWDSLGVVQKEQGEKGRYPWFKTPHIDRIAGEGVRFRNAFVTLPLCAPSRAAFLTGRYNHGNGVVNNHTPFPENSVTYASLLSEAGYSTAYMGKWHMGKQSGQRPGFSYSASFVGQGRFRDCPFEVNGETTSTSGWVDDVSTSYAIDFIREHKEGPFAVVLGFKSAHGPTQPPPRAANRFAGEESGDVPSLTSKAVYLNSEDGNSTATPKKAKAVNSKNAKRAKAGHTDRGKLNLNYFRTISAIDDNVGALLETLDELKLTSNTVVVFTSDNGYYQGEHGLSDKRSLYEESLRIPLVVRYPKLVAKPMVVDKMVLNIDIAPTFLELAGVKIPETIQGKSWVPLLKRLDQPWRDAFLMEYFKEQRFPGTPTTYGVRTDSAKLITYPGRPEWTELFDLKDDPYETRNLWNDPAFEGLQNQMEDLLKKEKRATDFKMPKRDVE